MEIFSHFLLALVKFYLIETQNFLCYLKHRRKTLIERWAGICFLPPLPPDRYVDSQVEVDCLKKGGEGSCYLSKLKK